MEMSMHVFYKDMSYRQLFFAPEELLSTESASRGRTLIS